MHTPFEDARFLRETIVDIDAAVVGISRTRWTALDAPRATQDEAARIMRTYRFDVLPIVDGTAVKGYFQTETWNNYASIAQKALSHRDIIPCHTHIRDVIKGLAVEGRLFYFLSSEYRVVGLVSVVNLNSRQVKVYLFSLLSELEVRLGDFIMAHVTEPELLAMTFGETTSEKYEDVKQRYEEDRAMGVDLAFVGYLYLADLISITVKKDLWRELGYRSKSACKESLNPLNELRHAVAHPARALITNGRTVEKLWRDIDRIEEILFRLR